jgi:hypothetical protein
LFCKLIMLYYIDQMLRTFLCVPLYGHAAVFVS